jgi:hypothetical protein
MNLETAEHIAIILSLIVLVWQTRALKVQIARGELQAVYNRYLELTKIESTTPTLHKMFIYGKDFERFSYLTDEQLRERALSLLIFDQFAFLFNMSGQPFLFRVGRLICRRVPALWRAQFCKSFFDRHRTVWEINAEYVAGVLTNPLLIRAWRDWGLGETWQGSQFYEFVEQVIRQWQEQKGASI